MDYMNLPPGDAEARAASALFNGVSSLVGTEKTTSRTLGLSADAFFSSTVLNAEAILSHVARTQACALSPISLRHQLDYIRVKPAPQQAHHHAPLTTDRQHYHR